MVTRLNPEQLDRNERGLAACRAVIAAAKASRTPEVVEDRPLTRSEQIHAAAVAEAARQHEALNRLTRAHRPKEQQP